MKPFAIIPVALLLLLLIAVPAAAAPTLTVSGVTAQQATLSGTSTDDEVLLCVGAAPGVGYPTPVPVTNGTFSKTITSFPFIAGQTYYATAIDSSGTSAEISFSLPALTPAPVTTHGDIFHTLMAGNLSIGDVWTAEADLYARPFGGGDFGLAAFISLVSAFVFVILFLRSGDVIVPFTVAALIGGMLVPYLLPQFAEIGYAFMVAAMIGIGYSLYRRYI